MDHASGVPVSSITFNEVVVPEANIGATGEKAVKAIQDLVSAGSVARAAQLAGLGRAVLDATVSYTTNREQFGRPVGTFQAVQPGVSLVKDTPTRGPHRQKSLQVRKFQPCAGQPISVTVQ